MAMTWADRVGTTIYWRNLGQGYAEMFRGGVTASGMLTGLAVWLGMGKAASIALGVASMALRPALSVLCGWGIWRWRIIHAQIERERDNDARTTETLALLREIAENTRPRPPKPWTPDTGEFLPARDLTWSGGPGGTAEPVDHVASVCPPLTQFRQTADGAIIYDPGPPPIMPQGYTGHWHNG